jgi:hypothetical protein
MGNRVLALVLLASASYGQRWEVGTGFAHLSQAIVQDYGRSGPVGPLGSVDPGQIEWQPPLPMVRTVANPATVAPRITVSVSRMPSSTLRAFSGQMPEAAALYSIRACNATDKPQELDPGVVEQAIVRAGIAIVPRELARPTVERSQSRAAGLWRVVGIAAPAAASVLLGLGASNSINLKGWQVTGLSLASGGLKLVGDADSATRAQERRQFDDAGPWLTDMPAVMLDAGRCAPAVRALGSFDPSRKAFIVTVQ